MLFFGLTFWQAVGAIVLGSALGGLSHGVLTSWGPERGLAQMVLSRRPFGYRGNLLPAGLNAFVAGVGWFAVNSISGALALSALTGWNGYVCLVIGVVLMLVVAFLGHNFVHLFERVAFPVLVVVFLAGMALILPAAQTGPVGDAGARWLLDRARRDVRLRRGLEPLRVGLRPLPAARHGPARRPLRRPRPLPVLHRCWRSPARRR